MKLRQKLITEVKLEDSQIYVNNTLLNNQWIKEVITRKIRKYVEMNENENTTCQNLRDIARNAWGVVGALVAIKHKC